MPPGIEPGDLDRILIGFCPTQGEESLLELSGGDFRQFPAKQTARSSSVAGVDET
jgi:hypothetical protein